MSEMEQLQMKLEYMRGRCEELERTRNELNMELLKQGVRAEKLKIIIACAYQIAGAFDLPEHILDVLSDPEQATDAQIDALLPFAVPPLVLALPDWEKRKIVIASDEYIEGERVVCVAIEDPTNKGDYLSKLLSVGYKVGTLTSSDSGGAIHLHYGSIADAENAFDYLSDCIDAAMKGDK